MIIYRYLLSQYVKVLLLCAGSFIAILLTTRLDEIAHFAALGAKSGSVLWFGLHQIPYILPLVIPISCLISAIVLVQRLSSAQELTALRASGFSLQQILAPILITAAFLSLANFYIVSELATESHLAARKLEHDLRLINPLLLVKNKHLSKIKDIYIQAAKKDSMGDSVADLFLAVWDKRNHRINLVYARQLGAEGTTLHGKDVTIMANMENPHAESDNVAIENIGYMKSSFEDFSHLLKQRIWRLKHNDYLRMSLLIHHMKYTYRSLIKAEKNSDDPMKIHEIKQTIATALSEISRRISIALAVFTFTLMGSTFGINISKKRSRKGIYAAVSLAIVFLLSFFSAKGLEANFFLATSLYLLPHIAIVLSSIWALCCVSKGLE